MTGPIPDPTLHNPTLLSPVNPLIETYMRGLVNKTDQPVLLAMESLARERNFPIVDRLVGIFLETQARAMNAKRIFEFGSGYGYSAYWFAKAVGAEGQAAPREFEDIVPERTDIQRPCL